MAQEGETIVHTRPQFDAINTATFNGEPVGYGGSRRRGREERRDTAAIREGRHTTAGREGTEGPSVSARVSNGQSEVATVRSNEGSTNGGMGNWWEDDRRQETGRGSSFEQQRGQQPSYSSISPAPPLLPLDHRFSPTQRYTTLNPANGNGIHTATSSNYPSSGSSSSPSLLLSPLSPFVEPFSPSLNGAMNGLSIGSSSTWGLGLGKGSSQGSTHELSPTTPTTDLRQMYSAQAQQFHLDQQSQQQPALFPFLPSHSLPPHSPSSTASTNYPYSPPHLTSQLQSLNTSITPLPFDLYADSRGGSEVDALSPRLGGGHGGRGGGFSEGVGSRGVVGMGIGLVGPSGVAGSLGGLIGGGPPSTSSTSLTHSGTETEEISTIFVVGFPDDMNEREFQNMFVFAQGFEAASLKVPMTMGGGRERGESRERAFAFGGVAGGGSVTSAGAGSGITATAATATSLDGGGPYEHSSGHPPLDGPASSLPHSFSATSLSTTREAAGSPASTAARKQIIGFAKFRTRAQALEARDILTGKRVDADKGNVLKAEMAKKNLHTKRGLSNELGGAGTSFPLSALDATTLARLGGSTAINPAVLAELARQTVAAQAGAASVGGATDRDARQIAAFDAFHSVPPTSYAGSTSREYYEEPTSPSALSYYKLRSDGRPSYTPTSPTDFSASPFDPPHSPPSSSSQTSPHVRNTTLSTAYIGNSMLQQLEESPTDVQSSSLYEQSSNRLPRSPTTPQYPFNSPPSFPTDAMFGMDERQNAYRPTAYQFSPPGAVVRGGVVQAMGLNGIPRTQNPADMNAPKNTLYVGGLPAVLPSLTGPFSAAYLEDSLRNVFSRCAGFRRLCFRSKSNGPIVFVEFTDVGCATRAMTEMYGNTLGGIVKGGIRLSYSKNPLGVRTGSIPNGSSGPLSPLVGGASSDETFMFNHYNSSNPPLRRPSESVFGTAPTPSMVYQGPPHALPPPQNLVRSPTNLAPGTQFAGSFSPFGTYDH